MELWLESCIAVLAGFIMHSTTSGKEGGTGNPCRLSGEIKYRHQHADYAFLPG